MPYKDPAKQKQYQSEWHRRKNIRDRRNKQNYSIMRFLRAVRTTAGCIDCGYNEYSVALDFDHREGETKKFTVSRSSDRSWRMIVEELMKCDIRCANCHRVQTHRRKYDDVV